MAVWPESAVPLADGYDNTPIENIRRTPSEAGSTQSRDLWAGATKFKAEFEMRLSLAASRTAIAFWMANRAAAITYFDFDSSVEFDNESIGTGDGSALNFTIPAKRTTATSAPVVQVADGAGGWTTKTSVTHYNISAGTGALGEDRVIFTAGNAPANGRAVRISYIGRHRYTVDIIAFDWHTVSSTGRKQFHVRLEEAW
jgi:hypothetical protein